MYHNPILAIFKKLFPYQQLVTRQMITNFQEHFSCLYICFPVYQSEGALDICQCPMPDHKSRCKEFQGVSNKLFGLYKAAAFLLPDFLVL